MIGQGWFKRIKLSDERFYPEEAVYDTMREINGEPPVPRVSGKIIVVTGLKVLQYRHFYDCLFTESLTSSMRKFILPGGVRAMALMVRIAPRTYLVVGPNDAQLHVGVRDGKPVGALFLRRRDSGHNWYLDDAVSTSNTVSYRKDEPNRGNPRVIHVESRAPGEYGLLKCKKMSREVKV